jgi:AraC-like DNA-binding protein
MTQPNQGKPEEQVKFWLAPELGQLELLHASYITHAFTRHTHDGFAIGIIERGAEGFFYRGANYVAPAGSIVAINPGEVHTGQAAAESGWTYRMLYPEVGLLQRAVAQLPGAWGDSPYFPEPVITDPYLTGLIRQLHLTLEDPAMTPLEREACFVDTLGQLIIRHAWPQRRPHPAAGYTPQAIRQAREYLDAHLAETILLDDLASLVNLSPFHFLRAFRAEMGLPPHAYQTQRRIAQAKALLVQGWPVAQVAAATGFTDQSHLTKRFKRIVGVAPGQFLQYRKNVQDKTA